MAPREFIDQTCSIINYMLYDRDDLIECDSISSESEVKVAEKLRELGDHFDETVIQPLMKEVKQAAVGQAAVAFSNSVDTLCKSWVAERAEIVPEKQLLKAAVMLGMYAKRNCPDMIEIVQDAMISFVDNRLSNWILQQGGWERASLC